MIEHRLLMTPRETAEALSISERTLWSITQRGELPHLKIGRLKRYAIDDVLAYIEATKQNGNGAADYSDQQCGRCGQPATHQHTDPLRSVDESRCDLCCDKNCDHLTEAINRSNQNEQLT